MASSLRFGRVVWLVPILLVAVCAIVAVQIAGSGPIADHSRASTSLAAPFHRASNPSPVTTTTTTAPATPPTTTTTAPAAPPPPTTTTVPPPPPVQAETVSAPGALPPQGQASVWGCAAAEAYLSAYAYPGFAFECPGNALGHEAMTCLNEAGVCAGAAVIYIADPCPAAYMNEASNSWVLEGKSSAPIDPYGQC